MNGLDNEGITEIRNILLGLKRQGKPVLLISHNKEDIDVLYDHIYEMNHGKIVIK